MEKVEGRLTPEIRRALLVAMARQNEAGFVRGEELGVSRADLDEMEDAGWLRRMNDLPHGRRCYQVTHLGMSQILPPSLKAILRDDVSEDATMTFQPDPDDNALLIGSNGHRYAARISPATRWQHKAAYEALDRLTPDAIPVNVRLLLAGIIANLVDDVAQKVARKYVKPN